MRFRQTSTDASLLGTMGSQLAWVLEWGTHLCPLLGQTSWETSRLWCLGTGSAPVADEGTDWKDYGVTVGYIPCLLGPVEVTAGMCTRVGISPVSLVTTNFLGDRQAVSLITADHLGDMQAVGCGRGRHAHLPWVDVQTGS